MVKVSVILPSLNVEPYIRQCILSAKNQSLADLEIICVDAGSTDGTLEIITDLAKEDNRISIFNSAVKSYGYQVNLGISKAKGKYIAVLETDDFVDKRMYERLYEAAEIHNVEIAKGAVIERFEDQKGNYIENVVKPGAENMRAGFVFEPNIDPSCHVWDGHIWDGIYRRDFLINNNITLNESPGAAFQDIGFLQQVLNCADKIIYLDEPFYHYRVNRIGNSTFNSNVIKNTYQEYKRIFESMKLKAGHVPYVYARMVPAFLHEINKAIIWADYDITEVKCYEGIEWFMKQMNIVHDKLAYSKHLISDWHLQLLDLMLCDLHGYINYLKDICGPAFEWLKVLSERMNGSDVVLFGAGKYGMITQLFLLRNGVVPVAQIDNNEDCWGIKRGAYYIEEPRHVIDNNKDAKYIIANKNSVNDIQSQLLEHCIKRDAIYYMNQTSIFESMRKTFVL